MNRRDFLTRVMMLAGAIAVDPEFLLWTPKSMITVPEMPSVLFVDYGHADDYVMGILRVGETRFAINWDYRRTQ